MAQIICIQTILTIELLDIKKLRERYRVFYLVVELEVDERIKLGRRVNPE
jgi:hypothetical protein